jgi:hypothetical protein
LQLKYNKRGIDALNHVGEKPGPSFNIRLGGVLAPRTSFLTEKLPILKWKFWLKELLGYFPFVLVNMGYGLSKMNKKFF